MAAMPPPKKETRGEQSRCSNNQKKKGARLISKKGGEGRGAIRCLRLHEKRGEGLANRGEGGQRAAMLPRTESSGQLGEELFRF
jgi:hypothetical protein